MSLILDEDRVSETQERLLEEARSSPTSAFAIDDLLHVCRDEDITSGRETIHPEWARLFEVNFRTLQSRLGRQELEGLARVFRQAHPFDSEVLTLDVSNARVVFLLGAGASKPSPSDIPTVAELLPDLLQRARRLNRQDLDRLAEFCEESKIKNIEDLLTAAQLSEFCSRNPIVLRLIEFLIYRKGPREEPRIARRGVPLRAEGDLSAVAFLQDTLQVLFGLLSSRMLPAKPNAAHKAIAKYVRSHKNASIVTTNYDCCMDLALGTEGSDFSYLVDFSNTTDRVSSAQTERCLIKLHGSLNWFYCDTCQKVHLIDIKKTVKEYMSDSGCYSVIAVCRDCGGQRRGLLVPPLAMKFDLAPPLTPLIESAQEAFNNADMIIVVGFSFADADLYISRMLTKRLQSSKHVSIVVFDPDYGVVDRLRRQMSLRIGGFDPKRILRVGDDCSKAIPAFLSGKMKSLCSNDEKDTQVAERLRQKIGHKTAAKRKKVTNHRGGKLA